MALSALQLSVRGPLTTHAGGGVARERAPLPTARGSAGLPSPGGERGAGWVMNESLRELGPGRQRGARGRGQARLHGCPSGAVRAREAVTLREYANRLRGHWSRLGDAGRRELGEALQACAGAADGQATSTPRCREDY